MTRATSTAPLLAIILPGCIGDLPANDYPCLIATGRYDKYNEAWVFSPRIGKKREALARAT